MNLRKKLRRIRGVWCWLRCHARTIRIHQDDKWFYGIRSFCTRCGAPLEARCTDDAVAVHGQPLPRIDELPETATEYPDEAARPRLKLVKLP